MRAPGMVHTLASSSTSPQVIPRTSPERAAVRIAKASAFAAMPSRCARSTMNAGASRQSSAAWCSTAAPCRAWAAGGRDGPSSAPGSRRCAAHRLGVVEHGLDPLSQPARGLRSAVQIGFSTAITRGGVDRLHVEIAKLGIGQRRRRVLPLLPCLALRQPDRLLSISASAAALNVRTCAAARRPRLRLPVAQPGGRPSRP